MASVDEKLFPAWEVMGRVEDMSERELDELPFGAIQLDANGKILRYNHTEAKISGLDPKSVLGKNFFTEVAPCTNVQEFGGRFREGVTKKSLNAVFPYHFNHRMRPTDVWVRLFYSKNTESAWVFVTQQRKGEG